MKSFINYVGSKRFLCRYKLFPQNINNYYEPFVGGGSVFFCLNDKYDIKKCYINDLNKDLITVYKTIKTKVSELLIKLEELNKNKSKTSFNNYVKTFNTNKSNKVLLSAIYIYISKISFNSNFKYRKDNTINPNHSKYNTKKNIYNEENIKKVSKLLKNTIIKNQDYKMFLSKNKPKKGDFVFLDPPYYVKDVTQYYENTFNLKDFEKLKDICDTLNKNKVNFMVTLNDNKVLKKLFKNYKIKCIDKNSTVSNKTKVEKEVVITNY